MHFLGARIRDLPQRALWSLHAAVKVRVVNRNTLSIVLPEDDERAEICVLKHDAILAALPPEVCVVGPDGENIRPSGTFVVTIETFDPFHLLADVSKNKW